MKRKYPIIKVVQPIGEFYLSSIPADVLLKIVINKQRSMGGDGVQRNPTKSRIKEIASFCSNSDSVFPTPIIVSVNSSLVSIDDNTIEFDDNVKIGEVLDGQHRLLGLENSGVEETFQMPVVFMFGLTAEEKAYVFSIINSKQTKVSASLLYDLFDLMDRRSPQKTAHELARSMNNLPYSPFYNRLKMLGSKEPDQDLATLSQGTFAQSVMLLYSKFPNRDKDRMYNGESIEENDGTVLRHYFVDEKDEIILKILLNCFKAISLVFAKEWNSPKDNILCKTTGFRAIIKALPKIIEKGYECHYLTQDFFRQYFDIVLEHFNKKGLSFSSASFGSGEAAQNKLAEEILKPIENFKYHNLDNNTNE
jgi:DGQHR domain-containing protein